MPRIRILLEGDKGEPLAGSAELLYSLNSACNNLGEIEASVESFKRSALPEIERRLLEDAQERQIEREKGGVAGDVTARYP